MSNSFQDRMTISSLARNGRVPTSTLRYYEREKLLVPSDRSPSGYRLYGPRDLERLKLIRFAVSSGLTIDDIKKLLKKRPLENDRDFCGSTQSTLARRLSALNEKISELTRLRDDLQKSLDDCGQSESDVCKNICEKA